MLCSKPGPTSVPFYSPENEEYYARVHRNGRDPDQHFGLEERPFRRYPEASLVAGKPVPLVMQFDAGVSVNRERFSEPQDVLEPDCCDGRPRPGHVVLALRVSNVPNAISTEDRSGRVFQFRPKHTPCETCYPTQKSGATSPATFTRIMKDRLSKLGTNSAPRWQGK
jgi:hypothetical protein